MVNEPFDDDGWPDPQLLAAWRVPSLADDFTDRVLAHASIASVRVLPENRRRERRSLAPIVAAITTALAVAAVLVLVFSPRTERIIEVRPAPAPASDPTPAVATTTPVPATTQLVLDVTPRDATVLVDGRPVAGPAPFVVGELASGPHAIDVRREGFVPIVMVVEVGGQGLRLELELVDAEPPAPASTPAAKPSPRARVQPKSSLHRDLKDPFHRSSVDHDEDGSLQDPFAKAPAPAAKRTSSLRIGVLAGARPARVSVDGRVVGTTPIANHRVTPGQHRIRWDWDDGHSFEQSVVIADGETKLVKGG